MPHIFVTENDAVVTFRQDLLTFFTAKTSGSIVPSALLDALKANAAGQLTFTVNALASKLPIFSITMEGELVADGE